MTRRPTSPEAADTKAAAPGQPRSVFPRASVIIPVYRDWPRLQLCVDALQKQTLSRDSFEIIVVDNDDNALPAEQRPAGLTYVHEPQGYSYTARNAGIAVARAPIIAFTDADCIPEPDWLEQGLRVFDGAPDIDVIGGEIDLFLTRHTTSARYDLAYGLKQKNFFETRGCFATANVMTRARVLSALDNFDASLESGGDFDFCRRAGQAGYRLAFVPQAIVRHPTRERLRQLLGQSRRVAGGFIEFTYRRECPTLPQAWLRILRTCRPRPRDYWFALAGGRGSEAVAWYHRPGVMLMRILMQYHFAWSLVGALTRSSRERGWP